MADHVTNTHPTMTRLAVNINEETQKQLRHLMDRDGITVTEAVRRLIGIGAYVDQQISDKGLDVVVHESNGNQVRLSLLGELKRGVA